MHKPVSKVLDPYQETDVHYMVIDLETMAPDIVEVAKETHGSFRTLQEAKSHAMNTLKERLAEGMESLQRIRAIGIDIPRLM